MSPIVQCPSCGSQYQAEDDQLDTQLQCSTCNSTFTAVVPDVSGAPAPIAYAQTQGGNGRAIASLVLGIVSIPTCFLYGIVSLICGILAVVFGVSVKKAIQRGETPESARGLAKAGRICGWVGILLSLLYWVVLIGVIVWFGYMSRTHAYP